jgi:hypothetical protein
VPGAPSTYVASAKAATPTASIRAAKKRTLITSGQCIFLPRFGRWGAVRMGPCVCVKAASPNGVAARSLNHGCLAPMPFRQLIRFCVKIGSRFERKAVETSNLVRRQLAISSLSNRRSVRDKEPIRGQVRRARQLLGCVPPNTDWLVFPPIARLARSPIRGVNQSSTAPRFHGRNTSRRASGMRRSVAVNA